jgi:hypothetical protein
MRQLRLRDFWPGRRRGSLGSMGRSSCALAAACLSSLVACQLSQGGLGGGWDAGPLDATGETGGDTDATTPGDAATIDGGDGASTEGGCTPQTCGGACCGDTCLPRSCAGCATGGLFCPSPGVTSGGTCVASCGSCTTFGDAASCYACADAGLTASCAASSTTCPADLDAGACVCPSGTAEECPGPDQVCSTVGGALVCLSP